MKVFKNIFINILITYIIISLIFVTTTIKANNYYTIKTYTFTQTLYVGGSGPNNYTKIQDAIDNATNGDTIYVYKGSYHEHIQITKEITLLGETREQTIIVGNYSNNMIRIQANNTKIMCFTIKYGRIGIYVVDSSNFTITQNILIDNWEGIGALDSSNGLISSNILKNNDFEGINPVGSTEITISGNYIENGIEGIFLSSSISNIIYGNTIRDQIYGLEAGQSSNNNKIYHNNFYDNDQNAKDACTNTWDDDYPNGGNYWDDYNGKDNNGDGIGDTPYPIPGGDNEDRYPLTEPWNNSPPDTPTIDGPIRGKPREDYNFTFITTDPDGDNAFYYIDWGDGTNCSWIGPYNSGKLITRSHSWLKKGTYIIKCKAKDEYGMDSDWGQLEVVMPRTLSINSPFMKFLERFQHLFPLLRYLLEL